MISEINCDDPHFNYVLALKGYPKVCFGAGQPRYIDFVTGAGITSDLKRFLPEFNPRTGPGCYSINRWMSYAQPSDYPHGSIAMAGANTPYEIWIKHKTPCPTRYHRHTVRICKQQAKPFGVGSKVRELKVQNVPGPGKYNIRDVSTCRRQNFQYNFGRPERVPCIETICVSDPTDTCHLCNKVCEGDYWHKNHELFLCQRCVDIELRTQENYNKKLLKQYKKIRNCSYMHYHNKTKAAMRTMTRRQIRNKYNIENYLSLYMDCF